MLFTHSSVTQGLLRITGVVVWLQQYCYQQIQTRATI